MRVHWRDGCCNKLCKVDRPWQTAVFEGPHSTDQAQDVPPDILWSSCGSSWPHMQHTCPDTLSSKTSNVQLCTIAAFHHEMVSSWRVNFENLVRVVESGNMEHANAQKKRHCSTSSRHPLHVAPLAIRHPSPYPIDCNKRFSPAHTHAKEQTHFSCFSAEQKGHIGWWRRP